MNTEPNANSKSKKKVSAKTIIIIVAAAIVLAGTAFVFYKSIKKFFGNGETAEVSTENNVTFFKCHMFGALTDSDINGIKEVVSDAVGDKVLEISKGNIPLAKTQFLTDENGEVIDVGDIVYITFSILDETEVSKMVTAIVDTYKLDEKYDIDINDIMELRNGYRSDYGK